MSAVLTVDQFKAYLNLFIEKADQVLSRSFIKGASKNKSVFRSILLHSSPRTDLGVGEPKGCRSQSFTNASAPHASRRVSTRTSLSTGG